MVNQVSMVSAGNHWLSSHISPELGDRDRIEPVVHEYDVPEAFLQIPEELPYPDSL